MEHGAEGKDRERKGNMGTAKNLRDILLRETGKIIIGKEEQVTLLLMAVFSGGHILLDDLPGSGKTTLIKTLSRALNCDFRRIQFTPDLLPSDILGMTVFDQKTAEFRMKKGPVFTNILLADEINRAIPRTQSALLEAMEEHQVTIDGETLMLPEPFFVMATQNPVERESTFPLPAAQMDRFFLRISLGYPNAEEEARMLEELGNRVPLERVSQAAAREDLLAAGKEIDEVFVSPAVRDYIVALVHATRTDSRLDAGASPRASKALFQGGKAWAAMKGRDFVTPDDVREIAVPILNHRIILRAQARFGGITPEYVIREILSRVPVPALGKASDHSGNASGGKAPEHD